MRPDADWDDLRHFLALARAGSVRAAGAVLGVSHTTVARRVEGLEKRLGVRLFDRHRGGWILTLAGMEMKIGAERVESEVGSALRDVSGRDSRLAGPVRLTCGDDHLAAWLVSALAPWCATHPEVELALRVDPRMADLAKGEADLAVRVLVHDRPPPDHLTAWRAAPLTFANYVARAHAHRLDPETGGDARWLGFSDVRAAAVLQQSSSYPSLPVWGEFSSLSALVQATLDGLGATPLPTYVGDLQPGLQRLARADIRRVAELWLLMHPELRGNVRVRSAREALQAAFTAQAALFHGGAPAHPSGPDSHHTIQPPSA